MAEISLKKNYIYRLAYEVLSLITPLITAPYVSRVLGADYIGINSYTSSIMAYFTMFAALGTMNYGTREVARLRNDKKALSEAFWGIEIITCISSGVCLIGWFILISQSEVYKYYFLALSPLLLATMADINWLYTGLEKVSYTVIRNTFCKVLGIILLFVFVKQKSDLLLYMVMNSMIQLAGNLSMWPSLSKFVCWVEFKKIKLWSHFKNTLDYFIITIAISLYTVLDKVLIGLITQDNYQNGYYEQATKIINMAKSLSFVAVNSIMTARMSYLFKNNNYDEIKQRITHSIDFILLVAWGLCFGIIAVADTFVPLFFGPGYEPVVVLLDMMSPLLIIIALSTCLGSHYYLPNGQIRKSTKYTITGSVINCVFNILLIPLWGALGAVIGTLIGELLISVLYVHNSAGYLQWRTILRCSFKRVIAGTIMLAVSALYAHHIEVNNVILLLAQIISCIAVYIVVLICFRDKVLLEAITNIKKTITHAQN